MTLFVSFRSQNVGGAVVAAHVQRGDGTADPLALQPVGDAEVPSLVAGKNVLFATHGFNVSLQHGARSLGQLEPRLGLTANDVYFGVLWPGDFFIPVINYPFEGNDAIDCGKKLADFCTRFCAQAQSLAFISHSLGARLVLEAVKNLGRPARVVCMAAAAINRDCLATEYSGATARSDTIALLASHRDLVLKIAFPLGDPIAVLLHDDHTPFQPALGYGGPPVPAGPPVGAPWQIPDAEGFDHGDYLPPGDAVQDPATIGTTRWSRAAAFMGRAFRGERQTLP